MKLLNKRMMYLKGVACAALLCCTALPAKSQQVTVDASIDSLTLLIGEQAKVKLEVSLDADKTLQLPFLKDTLVTGVEILEIAKPDTQYLNDRKRMLITQEYTITSFDSALYYLPPLEVLVNNEAYRSQALALKVYSIPVDTLNPEAFFGPKAIREVSLTWADVSTMVFLFLLLLALGGLGYYLFMRWIDNKPIIRKIKVEPKIPAHQQALSQIERIKADKSLRSNDPKAYYTELTDILRIYMEERFGFSALEMTSSEIIENLKQIKDKESVKELMYLFQTADLVKFAKHSPLMNENDMNLVNAVEFINETKVEVDPNAKPEPTEITVVEKRSKTGTMWLLGTMITVGVSVIVVLYFLARDIYRLWF
ncbi:MAG: hypothetical protein ACRC8J_05305 [Phocaeicola sp.]